MSKLVIKSKVELELVPTSRESVSDVLPYAYNLFRMFVKQDGRGPAVHTGDPANCPECAKEAAEKDLKTPPNPATV